MPDAPLASPWPDDGTPSGATTARVLRHRTLHGQVVELLGARIVAGDFPVGSKLPIEDELAARLGVSRGGVREAVKALAAKGLVAPRPRVGTIVQPRERWNLLDHDVIEWHGHRQDGQFVRDLLELRQFVEPEVARLAAERAGAADVERLRAACAALERTAPQLPDSEPEFVAADLDLHLTLLQACGNDLVRQLSRLLEAGLQHSIEITSHLQAGVIAAVPLHRDVVEAVARGDSSGAGEAMRRILSATGAAMETEAEGEV